MMCQLIVSIRWATASAAIFLPPRDDTRQNRAMRKQSFFRVIDHALCVRTRLKYGLPFRVQPE